MSRGSIQSLLAVRIAPSPATRRLVGAGAVAFIVLLWWLATAGLGAEERFISPVILPSPAEVARSFPALFRERALLESIAATLRRVLIGFGLAALVGIPFGIIAGFQVAAAGFFWFTMRKAAPDAIMGRHA